jgi:plastocyanin
VGIFSGALTDGVFAADAAHQTVALKKEPAGIAPNPAKVKSGTTVIWINHDPQMISIRFEGKISLVCGEMVNFYGDIFDFYESSQIPQGGIASICFLEKGTYNYEVKRLAKEAGKEFQEVSNGSVVVE